VLAYSVIRLKTISYDWPTGHIVPLAFQHIYDAGEDGIWYGIVWQIVSGTTTGASTVFSDFRIDE